MLVAMEVKGRCRELDDMSGLACCGFSPAQRETIPATVVAGDGGLCYCFFFLFFFFLRVSTLPWALEMLYIFHCMYFYHHHIRGSSGKKEKGGFFELYCVLVPGFRTVDKSKG